MGENTVPTLPEPEKKEEKKKNIITFTIDLDDLYGKFPTIPTPDNQRTWASKEEMTSEYQRINSLLRMLIFYIVRTCNEGAEVKENVAKRIVLARTILGIFIENLNLNGYTKYGMLFEMLEDIYLSVSGKTRIMNMLGKIQAQEDHLASEKAKDYTS